MNRYAILALVPALALAACGGGDDSSTPSTPGNAEKVLDVAPCLNQLVAGRKVVDIVVPDVVTLDTTKPGGYPNGRRLEDPVVDLTLAAIFLDVTKTPVDTLAKLPLDPSGNDKPLPGVFPYLADPWGGVPASNGTGGFSFRTEAASAYTRVDRMGEPAVATALIGTGEKTAYNDDSPTVDATGKWANEIITDLTNLTKALRDDFTAAKLPQCATET